MGLALGGSHLGIGAQDQPGVLVNGRVTLWAYVPDCDAALVRLRRGGVAILQEAADQPWGERMARLIDPDGNVVIVASRAAAEP